MRTNNFKKQFVLSIGLLVLCTTFSFLLTVGKIYAKLFLKLWKTSVDSLSSPTLFSKFNLSGFLLMAYETSELLNLTCDLQHMAWSS
jgi:DNA-binding transcriptional regulator GbsR (MarR family)